MLVPIRMGTNEFAFWSRVEGKWSKVEGKWSRVEDNKSRVKKLFTIIFHNYFLMGSPERFLSDAVDYL